MKDFNFVIKFEGNQMPVISKRFDNWKELVDYVSSRIEIIDLDE